MSSSNKVHIAVEGCCHGELDKIYSLIDNARRLRGRQVDVLLICGDFQGVRNQSDLQCLAVPEKYRSLNSFHEYVNGSKVAPVLTIIIGGNHEASNILQNLYYGGWIAPNIYFLGYAGVVCINDSIKIGGLSGIYNSNHYHNTHFEVPPYSPDALRSVYHVRELEIFRLAQYTAQYPQSLQPVRGTSGYHRSPIDVFLSHDWPQHIWEYGDMNYLLKVKPYFRKDIETHQLGSPVLMTQVLRRLRPRYWFAAHLHVKFGAVVPHVDIDGPAERTPSLPGKRKFDDLAVANVNTSGSFDTVFEDEEAEENCVSHIASVDVFCGEVRSDRNRNSVKHEPVGPNKITRFLALDKIHGGGGRGGGRAERGGFLQFISLPVARGRRRQLLRAMGPDADGDADWAAASRCLQAPDEHANAAFTDGNEIDIDVDEEGPDEAGPKTETVLPPAPPVAPPTCPLRPPPPPGPPPTNSVSVTLSYDLEWLAIIRKTHHLLSSEGASPATMHRVCGTNTQRRVRMPTQFPLVTDEDIEDVYQRFVNCRGGSLVIPSLQPPCTAHAAHDVSTGNCSASEDSLPTSFGSQRSKKLPETTPSGAKSPPARGDKWHSHIRGPPSQGSSSSYYGPSPSSTPTPVEYELGNRQTDELLDLLQLPHIWTRRCPEENQSSDTSSMTSSSTDGHGKGFLAMVPSQVLQRRPASTATVDAAAAALGPERVADDNELDIDDL